MTQEEGKPARSHSRGQTKPSGNEAGEGLRRPKLAAEGGRLRPSSRDGLEAGQGGHPYRAYGCQGGRKEGGKIRPECLQVTSQKN